MKTLFIAFGAIVVFSSAVIYKSNDSGKPWKGQPQQIPGKVECEFYNTGGEGVAYHDSDSINNGSGKLNPANGDFLNEFRMNEGVDISYTKSHDIDNNPYSKVPPQMNQLYVGWTKPGEWINYTVNVKASGNYKVGVMYTSNGDGAIALDMDGVEIAKSLKINSTHTEADTVKWRQWHHWNKSDSLGSVQLKKGLHTLKLHIVENGNMNLDYLEFTKEN